MIVSLEYIWEQCTYGILMREVETEQEAFAEMRRFLEVNNISSNATETRWRSQSRCKCLGSPRIKEVIMLQSGVNSKPSPCFGIYYGTDRPKYDRLGSYKKYGLTMKMNPITGEPFIENGEPILVSSAYPNGCKWYIPLVIYLMDLKERIGGDT